MAYNYTKSCRWSCFLPTPLMKRCDVGNVARIRVLHVDRSVIWSGMLAVLKSARCQLFVFPLPCAFLTKAHASAQLCAHQVLGVLLSPRASFSNYGYATSLSYQQMTLAIVRYIHILYHLW